jgi:hypothetical protein
VTRAADHPAYQARAMVASGDLDAAILHVLRCCGEDTSQGIVGKLGLALTDVRKVAGRLRSLEHRGRVEQRYTGFTDTNYWVATKSRGGT